MGVLSKKDLVKEYTTNGKSASEIACKFKCSENKVNYWLKKHGVKKRTISEAVYKKLNPKGDPFVEQKNISKEDYFLYGIGLGLYWGEGTKSNKFSVRLGNSDPSLIRAFIAFLRSSYDIEISRIHFGLQLFSDISEEDALKYWCKSLNFKRSQFYNVTISKKQGKGTYKNKSKHGVVTLYFNNKKLRDVLCKKIEDLQRMY